MTVLVLGDQLTTQVGPLARADPDTDGVLMVEATEFARRHPYHPHKLTLLFSAMRHFRDRLRGQGYTVDYRQADTFGAAFDAHFDRHPGDELVLMRPSSYGATERLQALVENHDGTLTVRDNDLFLCAAEAFDEWAAQNGRYRHESFYRFMRRETGYLMEDGSPVGDQWNYDEQNRDTPPDDWDAPDVPRFEPDELTEDVREWVAETFDNDWADAEPFFWPVTRTEALAALDDFIDTRLPEFGPYQDAMLQDEWALNHALLSPALNLGLLHPREVCERVLEAYRERDLPLQSVEGYLRQVIGWREYMRHVYRREMPDLAAANQLDASEALPDFFWTGETEMACVADIIEGVRTRGYAHHIERLMVIANFATITGIDPQQLNRWFQAAFVDGFHWVATPNVVGMGTFGTDVLSTKPYAASANYIDRMSDHCAGCPYDPDATTGEDACPFNALYWDYLAEHEDSLRENYRMGLVYSHLDDKRGETLSDIRERAADIRRTL